MDFLERVIVHYEQQSQYTPIQSLSSAMAILQGIIGKGFISDTKNGRMLNSSYMGIGEAGANKTIMTKQMDDIVAKFNLSFPTYATPEALTSYINGKPNNNPPKPEKHEGCIIFDEITRFYNSPKHMDQSFTLLSQLWSSQRFMYETTARGSEGFPAGTAITFFGIGTEEALTHLKSKHFTQGFGRRPFWYRLYSQNREYIESDFFSDIIDQYVFPQECIEFLKFIRLFVNNTHKPYILKWSKKAKRMYIDVLNVIHKKSIILKKSGNKYQTMYMNSAPEHLSILAGTKCISNLFNPKLKSLQYKHYHYHESTNKWIFPEITVKDVKWAWKTYKQYLDNFIEILKIWKMGNVIEKPVLVINDIIDTISAYIEDIMKPGTGSFNLKAVKKNCGLSPKDFDEAFYIMFERGIIKINKKQRSTYYYVDIQDREEQAKANEKITGID
jgi:hypothetical protein